MSRIVAGLVVLLSLVCAAGAQAKGFDPGDLRLCSASRCVAVESRPVVELLATFYYGRRSPPAARAPQLGAPFYELRFRNGYVTGIVASPRLDRFLSYGVYLGHFQRGRWYRLPDRAAGDLRLLARSLAPLRLTRAALAKSR